MVQLAKVSGGIPERDLRGPYVLVGQAGSLPHVGSTRICLGNKSSCSLFTLFDCHAAGAICSAANVGCSRAIRWGNAARVDRYSYRPLFRR